MALSRAMYALDKALGKEDPATVTKTDISNYASPEHADPSGATMKALVWQGKNSVKIVDTPVPRLLEDTDAIVRVTGTTICGSDLHLLHGVVLEMAKGDILGHEFCGIVDSVGKDVTKVKPGKRYVASFQIACGDCFYCKQKLTSQCERTNDSAVAKSLQGARTAGLFGYSHFTGGYAGGQAEYVRIPFADFNLLDIPDDVPDEKALFLSDVLCTSYHAVKDTAVYEGDEVAIFGAGPIGQMAGVFALGEGAKKVIFIDTLPRTLEIKTRLPPALVSRVETLDYKEADSSRDGVVKCLKEMCNGGRGPDVAIDCAAGEYAKSWAHKLEIALGAETDTSEVINEMIQGVRNFGRCGVTGVYLGYTNHVALGSLMQRGIRLIGNGQAPVQKYWEELMEKIRSGELDPLQMVSHRVRLEDLEEVYARFNRHEDGIQKVFVETKFSGPPTGPPLTRY
jgi:threonine dehydrogenase-like Zn-dependent dehydrogenase